jgi:hypothetical protein
MLPRLLRPRLRTTGVPVQLLIPERDRFVHPHLSDHIDRFVPHLTRQRWDTGHWGPLLADPERTAAAIAAHARRNS